MTRNEQLIENVKLAMSDSSITFKGLLQSIHNSHDDVKHVYGVCGLDRDIKSIALKCHDRTLITFNFTREVIEPPMSWSMPIEL